MLRLTIAVSTIALLALVVLVSRDTYSPVSPASAGIIIPPPGIDEFDVNGKVDIDITLCCGTSEAVNLTGSMTIERGPASKEGTIPIEIVALSLTGTSSLLVPNDTPVTVSLNPNGGPALGQIIPLKSVAFFSLPFLDVQIGDNDHFLQQPVDMSATITGIPPYGDKFTSQPKANPIQDNFVQGQDGVRGTLDRLNIDIKPPTKKYSIHALKVDADTGDPVPGWLVRVFGGACNDDFAPVVDSGFTGDDGFVDFFGLQAGTYSVEEGFDPDWNPVTPPCVDVELPGTAGVAGDNFDPCPNPDPTTCDSFDSGALVNVGVVGSEELHGVTLNGPTVIKRDPVTPGQLDTVQTEIVQLDLTGTSTALGNIHVTLATRPDSTGKITEQVNNTPGVLDLPPFGASGKTADSFFDVFFEVNLEGVILHNDEPLHLECKIEQIPPELCAYEPPIPEPVQLFNRDGVKVAFIDHALHVPLPPNGRLVVFENEFKGEKKYSVRALKLDADTGDPISGWEIFLHDGACNDLIAPAIESGFTDADGYVEFTGLQPGLYSVEEELDPNWNPVTPDCVDVDLPGTAGAAGGGFHTCPNPDPNSCDSFDSGALVNVRLAGDDELIPVTLNGPTVIERGALIPGATDVVPTEILQMDLAGSSPVLGNITVRQSSDRPSLGEIEEQQNNTQGVLDLPPFGAPGKSADSFFDVFFEIDVGQGGLQLHNEQALHLECQITEIPPELCAYEPPIPDPIPLLDAAGNVIAFIEHAMHIPLPPNERLVVFHNRFKDEPGKKFSIRVLKLDQDGEPVPGWEMNLFDVPCGTPGLPNNSGFTDQDGYVVFRNLQEGLYSVEEKPQDGWNPIGATCVDVQLATIVAGFAACPNPDPLTCDSFDSGALVNVRLANSNELHGVTLNGPTVIKRGPVVAGDLDTIQTEIIQLGLSGSHPVLGQIFVGQSQTRPSEGKITEQENISGDMDFPADSFFDIFFEVEINGIVLHNQDPLRLECKIDEIPPELCAYQPPVPDPIPLYDDDKSVIAFIEHAMHIPVPPNEHLVVFRNERKDGVPPTVEPTKTPQPQQTRHVTLRCVRTSSDQKVTGSATVTEKKAGQPDRVRLEVSCNSNTNAVVRTSYSISTGATKNIQLDVVVDSRNNACSFPGMSATQAASVSCTASPEGLELTDSDTPGEPDDGDANKNGTTDSIDAALILQFIAGLTDPWPNSDTNENGITNAIDVALVLQFSAGLIPSLPV